jgi:hypothetical protein
LYVFKFEVYLNDTVRVLCSYMRSLKGDFVEVRKRLRYFLTNLVNIIGSAQCMEREI